MFYYEHSFFLEVKNTTFEYIICQQHITSSIFMCTPFVNWRKQVKQSI